MHYKVNLSIYTKDYQFIKRGCPKSVTAPFAIVYFGKK